MGLISAVFQSSGTQVLSQKSWNSVVSGPAQMPGISISILALLPSGPETATFGFPAQLRLTIGGQGDRWHFARHNCCVLYCGSII